MSKQSFLLIIALLGGLLQNHDKITRWLNPPPPRVAGQNDVVLYSTTWCGYCAKTREYFAENNIEYIDLDVETSEEGRREYQRLGGRGHTITHKYINSLKINMLHYFR